MKIQPSQGKQKRAKRIILLCLSDKTVNKTEEKLRKTLITWNNRTLTWDLLGGEMNGFRNYSEHVEGEERR